MPAVMRSRKVEGGEASHPDDRAEGLGPVELVVERHPVDDGGDAHRHHPSSDFSR